MTDDFEVSFMIMSKKKGEKFEKFVIMKVLFLEIEIIIVICSSENKVKNESSFLLIFIRIDIFKN